jgi:hypothetical protein
VDVGVLEEDYFSDWAPVLPSFAIPKKNGTIRVVTDLRTLNLNLKHPNQLFPIPNIGDMIHSMEGFTFASAFDLNMGYYHNKLDADAQHSCTIVFPWPMGNYKYKHIPMGIKIAPEVFQNFMSKLVQYMEYVKKTIIS